MVNDRKPVPCGVREHDGTSSNGNETHRDGAEHNAMVLRAAGRPAIDRGVWYGGEWPPPDLHLQAFSF